MTVGLTNSISNESEQIKICLLNQFHDVWQLMTYHLKTLTVEECLWRPGREGPHIFQDESGNWRGDLPKREDYDIGPPSIGWVTWHVIFWWSMVLNHSFGDQTLQLKDITSPDGVDALRTRILELGNEWVEAVQTLDGKEMMATTKTRWPFQNKPFSAVVGWVNMELMKNTAELGYIRFLHSQRRSHF